MQDVFARLVENPDRFDLGEAAEVLLFRLARNRCVDRRRKRTPRNDVPVEPAAADPRGGTDDRVDLVNALSSLPDAEREILLLTAVDGLGYREVAGIVDCSLGTVAARRCAAIQKLRARLSR